MTHHAISKFLARGRIRALQSSFGRPAGPEARTRVVIVGGGVAALEAAFALQELAGDRTSVRIVARAEEFTYRPLEVREPFAGARAPRYSLAAAARSAGAELVDGEVVRVQPTRRTVVTSTGASLPFDALILCLGATPVWPHEHARRIEPGKLDETLHGFVQDVEGEYIRSAVFIVPERVGWALPTYELLLMTAERAAGMQARLDLTLVTSEPEPLAVFGERSSAAVRARLTEAGVAIMTSALATVPGGKAVEVITDGRRTTLQVDSVLAAPELVGPSLAGIPHDEHGFIPVDGFGRVAGTDGVFAAGDATDGAIKQGGVAAQQAEVVARGVARLAGADLEVTAVEPRLHGVLLTGTTPIPLGSEPAGAEVLSETSGLALGKIAAPRLSAYLATLEPLAAAAG